MLKRLRSDGFVTVRVERTRPDRAAIQAPLKRYASEGRRLCKRLARLDRDDGRPLSLVWFPVRPPSSALPVADGVDFRGRTAPLLHRPHLAGPAGAPSQQAPIGSLTAVMPMSAVHACEPGHPVGPCRHHFVQPQPTCRQADTRLSVTHSMEVEPA